MKNGVVSPVRMPARFVSEVTVDPMANKWAAFARQLGFPEPVEIPSQSSHRLFVCSATIVPEAAQEIVDKHHIPNNRAAKHSAQARYMRDILGERWVLSHQAVAFLEDGKLFDGRNRLEACAKADKPFNSLVVFNVPVDAVRVVDMGCKRSVADAGKLAGIAISTNTAAIAKLVGWDGQNVSAQDILWAAEILAEPMAFCWDTIPSNFPHLTTTPTRSAIVKAWFHEDLERLRQFCECLVTGTVNGQQDMAARSLTGHLLREQNRDTHKFPAFMRKAENAISYFCRRKPLRSIGDVSSDKYPLPANVAAAIAGGR